MTGLTQGRVDLQVLLLIWLWLVLITKQLVEHSMIIGFFILGREWSTGGGISELILWTKKVWKYTCIYTITNDQKDIQVVIKYNTAMHDISIEDDNACIQFTDSKTRIIICSVNVYQIRVPPTPWTDPSSIEIITSSTGQTCSNACLYHKMVGQLILIRQMQAFSYSYNSKTPTRLNTSFLYIVF